MRLSAYSTIFTQLARFSLFHTPSPSFITWSLSNKCNLKCSYCAIANELRPCEELSRSDLLKLQDFWINLGTRFISITGGEPLLSDNIDVFIDNASKKGVLLSINTNGIFASDYIDLLKKCNEVNISLDGPKNLNSFRNLDYEYENILKSIMALRDVVKLKISVTINKENSKHLEEIVKWGMELKTPLRFQPVYEFEGCTNSKSYLLSDNETLAAINDLIRLKSQKKYRKYIANSISDFYFWKEQFSNKIVPNCHGGLLFLRVEPDGSLKICGRQDVTIPFNDVFKYSWKEISEKLASGKKECRICTASSVARLNRCVKIFRCGI